MVNSQKLCKIRFETTTCFFMKWREHFFVFCWGILESIVSLIEWNKILQLQGDGFLNECLDERVNLSRMVENNYLRIEILTFSSRMIGSIRSDVPATNIFNRKVFYIKTNIVTWIGGLELLLIHHCWTWNRQRYQRVSQSLFSYLLSLPLSPFPFQQRLKYHGNTEHQQLTWAKWNFVQSVYNEKLGGCVGSTTDGCIGSIKHTNSIQHIGEFIQQSSDSKKIQKSICSSQRNHKKPNAWGNLFVICIMTDFIAKKHINKFLFTNSFTIFASSSFSHVFDKIWLIMLVNWKDVSDGSIPFFK